MKHSDNHTIAKSVIGFLVLIVALGILMVFYNQQEEIMATDNFRSFVFVATLGLGFLVGLMYLVGQSKPQQKASRKKKR